MTLMYKDALGEILRERRHKLGYTLRRVSTEATIALGYLSEVERGHKEVSSAFLETWAKSLRTDVPSIVIDAGLRLASWRIPDEVPEGFSKEVLSELR